MTPEERRSIIWSVHAWVEMAYPKLSVETMTRVMWLALAEVLPDATEGEVGFTLGLVAP